MTDPWKSLLALVTTLLLLLLAKRWITRWLQQLSIGLVGDPDVALYLYFVLVLPGVLLHELSHWLVATLVGVPVGKLKLGPERLPRGRQVSLGSVQVAQADPLRSSLIGLAPLLGASVVILLIGNLALGVDGLARAVGEGGLPGFVDALRQLGRVPGAALWLYLVFAVSNAMLPSESDLAPVRPVLLFLSIAAAVMLLVAGVPAIPEEALDLVSAAAGYLASAFGLTLAVDALFMVVIGLALLVVRRVRR